MYTVFPYLPATTTVSTSMIYCKIFNPPYPCRSAVILPKAVRLPETTEITYYLADFTKPLTKAIRLRKEPKASFTVTSSGLDPYHLPITF